jgi:hypothetical protein
MSATIRHFVGLPNKNGVFVLHPSATLFQGVRGELTGANAATWNVSTPHRTRTSDSPGRRHLVREDTIDFREDADAGFLAQVKG